MIFESLLFFSSQVLTLMFLVWCETSSLATQLDMLVKSALSDKRNPLSLSLFLV